MIHQFQQFFWFQTFQKFLVCLIARTLIKLETVWVQKGYYHQSRNSTLGWFFLSWEKKAWVCYKLLQHLLQYWYAVVLIHVNVLRWTKDKLSRMALTCNAYKTGKGDRKTNIEGVDWLESFSNSILFNRNRITKFPISSAVIMQNHNHPPLPQYIFNFELIYFSFSTRYMYM